VLSRHAHRLRGGAILQTIAARITHLGDTERTRRNQTQGQAQGQGQGQAQGQGQGQAQAQGAPNRGGLPISALEHAVMDGDIAERQALAEVLLHAMSAECPSASDILAVADTCRALAGACADDDDARETNARGAGHAVGRHGNSLAGVGAGGNGGGAIGGGGGGGKGDGDAHHLRHRTSRPWESAEVDPRLRPVPYSPGALLTCATTVLLALSSALIRDTAAGENLEHTVHASASMATGLDARLASPWHHGGLQALALMVLAVMRAA
jgi:hypothetical protein